MRRSYVRAAAFAACLGAAMGGTALAQPANGGGWGPAMMNGYDGGPGGGWGPGMMWGGDGWGHGWGPGMMWGGGGWGHGWGPGPGGWEQPKDLNLTVPQVQATLKRWLEYRGNPNLELGSVTQKDSDTIIATIVTKDKQGLVRKLAIDRHTGFVRPVGD